MKDIQERTYKFALRVVTLSRSMPKSTDGNVIGRQVLRAGTSIAANVEEAEAATTKKDFIYKILIALREARETHYWLRIIRDSKIIEEEKLEEMVDEADQIKRILGAIASKARRNSQV